MGQYILAEKLIGFGIRKDLSYGFTMGLQYWVNLAKLVNWDYTSHSSLSCYLQVSLGHRCFRQPYRFCAGVPVLLHITHAVPMLSAGSAYCEEQLPDKFPPAPSTSPFGFSNCWIRCVSSSVTKGAGFSCTILWSS